VPLYLFALIDRLPDRPLGRGLGSPVAVRAVPGGAAVVERRADVPPVEMGVLKSHDRVVSRVWALVPAVLPVRFGTLLEAEELREALEERQEELGEAFELVRDRAQFTWRARVPARLRAAGARVAASNAMSGTEYLRRAAKAASPAPPRRYDALRKVLGPLVVRERFDPARGAAPERLYHLVERPRMGEYAAAAGAFIGSTPALSMTGPWPAYAFAPEILR
jgi:hypothetical protein